MSNTCSCNRGYCGVEKRGADQNISRLLRFCKEAKNKWIFMLSVVFSQLPSFELPEYFYTTSSNLLLISYYDAGIHLSK